MERKFIVTVDTEGDNLWAWHEGQPIATNNTRYIARFQELCEQYGFKPTYLTNYEMAMDDEWVSYAKPKAKAGLCEIGMHIHAWNSPPDYPLDNKFGGNSYITEYPEQMLREKVSYIVELLREKFEAPITSSRSGRWATDETYFQALVVAGIKIDCSVTPGIDLSDIPGCSRNCGNNYATYENKVAEIYPGLLEIPLTTRKVHWAADGSLKHKIKSLLLGEDMWLRSCKKSLRYLYTITEKIEQDGSDYLEFMLHSSELMPGGSPYFTNEKEVEQLYELLTVYFDHLKNSNYIGVTLSEYAEMIRSNIAR